MHNFFMRTKKTPMRMRRLIRVFFGCTSEGTFPVLAVHIVFNEKIFTDVSITYSDNTTLVRQYVLNDLVLYPYKFSRPFPSFARQNESKIY